jgi:hypothetical protein
MSRTPSVTPSGTPARQSRASSVSSVGAGDPLAPDFRPANYLVPQLRSLLLEHNIKVPSSARKPALIEAYEEHIRPRAAQLRQARDAAGGDSSFDSRDSPSYGKASGRREEGSTTPVSRHKVGCCGASLTPCAVQSSSVCSLCAVSRPLRVLLDSRWHRVGGGLRRHGLR